MKTLNASVLLVNKKVYNEQIRKNHNISLQHKRVKQTQIGSRSEHATQEGWLDGTMSL